MRRLVLLPLLGLLSSAAPPDAASPAATAPPPVEPVEPAASPASCAAPGTLTLATEPWTVVAVDGVVVGTTPLFRHVLPPGPHHLSLTNDTRGVAVGEDVVIEEGRERRLRLLLTAGEGDVDLAAVHAVDVADEACVADDDAAFVTVDTRPWSKVLVDGKLAGVTPVFQHRVAAGAHVVSVVGGNGGVRAVRFDAAAGEVVKVALDLGSDLTDNGAAAPVDDDLDVR